jgi:hypothetical protein
MAAKAFHRAARRRLLTGWLAVGLLFWQTLLTAGAFGPPMAPITDTGAGLTICTDHGLLTVPLDGSPAHGPADRSVPPCPCCLPFATGNATILAESIAVPVPDWIWIPALAVPSAAPRLRHTLDGPLQPRAPPLSI